MLKAKSFLFLPLPTSNTLKDVMRKSSVFETPLHEWGTSGNQIPPPYGRVTTGDLVFILMLGDQR